MDPTFNVVDGDLQNLEISLAACVRQITWTPASEPGVIDHTKLFTALHCAKQNIDLLLSRVEFSER